MSAVVEPIAGVIGAMAVMAMRQFSLRFGICRRCDDLRRGGRGHSGNPADKYTDVATLGFIGGFIVMMSLDVGLG